MRLSLSIFATIALSASRANAQDPPYIAFDAYGTPLEIANTELQYDQNQNHAAGVPPTVSADHSTIHSTGNRWSAYELPASQEVFENTILQFTFTLAEETVDGFQAICLDADRELTGSNGQCFALSTSQGWLDNFVNVAKLTGVNQTTHHSIPIGHFFTGPVNYLAFLQDSDGPDKSVGDSSISNFRLVQQDRNMLDVEINGVVEQLENHQLSYTFKSGLQDIDDWLMAISEDGASVQVNGNQWKALPLNSPYTITPYTILEFGIVVSEPGDLHAICLDSNLDAALNEKPCVTFLTHPDNAFHILTTEILPDVPTTLALPFGQIMGLGVGETIDTNYIAFIQDDDRADKRGGRSTYTNIRIYEEDRMEIEIKVFGQNVTVPNVQESLKSSSNQVQDSIDHVLSVSADGTKVTAHGNSWKRLKLDEAFDVTPSTMLKFHYEVPEEAEISMICLIKDTTVTNDGRADCFATSGKDTSTASSNYKKIQPYSSGDGAVNDYEILVGQYFTGPVHWLAFVQDNDKVYTPSRAEGESSWSNIEIYSLPSLIVGLDSGSFAIENNQKSYDSSQDSTPISDYLAVVSDDGLSVVASGNMWRALPLDPPMSAAELGDFVVSFDWLLTVPGEFHGVCFEDNLEWGDYDNPLANKYDPKRCLLLNNFDNVKGAFEMYQPAVGEPHRYVANLSKMFDRFYEWKYLVLIQDNDEDKSVGQLALSNIHVTTSLTSCLEGTDYSFVVSDCTVPNFLAGVKSKMMENSCAGDPLLELMALFDATTEMDVYKKIEFICSSAYEPAEFDFAKTISSETQLVGEFIDGGTILNYEHDSEGGNLAKDGASIAAADQKAASQLLSWPKHHALDHCDIGAAMCCWVDSRGTAELEDNSDVCYVNMKSSRRTAHVADGYSIYGDDHEGAVNCQGFAWGTDGGSIASALKGNALHKVGFMNELYLGLKGNVEQVPGAPMCGCLDRMPVVTHADCTKVSSDTSTVEVTYSSTIGRFSSEFTIGAIDYSDCGDLNTYYKTLVGETSHNAAYMDKRIVGEGGCHVAINGFLERKGLVKS